MSHVKKESSREKLPMQRVFRQRERVDNMSHDNEVLRLSLTQEGRDSKRAMAMSGSDDIGRLQAESENYMAKIEQERRACDLLNEQIAELQERSMQQKQKLGGANASVVNNAMINKQIRVLENRLDQSLVKFNEALAENRKLRKRIDDYRKERVVFDTIYKKLERELHEKKREMSAIIEDSKNAYQARDKAQSELRALREHAEKEKSEFEQEFKELGKLIQQERLMVQQMRLKHLDEGGDTGAGVSRATRDGERREGGDGGVNNTKQWGHGAKDKAPLMQLSQEKIQNNEDMLQAIYEKTGFRDVNEIIAKFLESEEKNFSLFNFVNDLNSEIERLELMIGETKGKIEKFKGQGVSSDTQRKKVLRDLEDRYSRTEAKADEYEQRYQRAMRTINQLKTGIHSIYTRIGCASSSVEEILGNQGVTESNMMQYLGIIEQRTSEILQMYAASQMGSQAGLRTMQLPVADAIEKNSRLSIQPPSYEDQSSDEDSMSEDDERPLTRQELDKRTQRELMRHARRAGKLSGAGGPGTA